MMTITGRSGSGIVILSGLCTYGLGMPIWTLNIGSWIDIVSMRFEYMVGWIYVIAQNKLIRLK